MEKLCPALGRPSRPWTARVPLPGGDFPVDGVADLIAGLRRDYPFLDEFWAGRLVRAYGTEASILLGQAKSAADLGRSFGATLTETELRWLMTREYAVEAADVVWRRSKLGLRLSKDEIDAIDAFMADERERMAAE
jgi:glycerol-3-phosphate dehydrogenase